MHQHFNMIKKTIAYIIPIIFILLIASGLLFQKSIRKLFLSKAQINNYCSVYKNKDTCEKDSWCISHEVSCRSDMMCDPKFMCYAK
jgi:hypothetical protein